MKIPRGGRGNLNILTLSLLAALGILCVIASCKNPSAPEISVTNYTVSFQSGDGTAIISKTVQEGSSLILGLPEYQPELGGYFFDGWYLQGDTKQTSLSSIKVTGNITLVAKWLKAVSVTLDFQGGKMPGNPGSQLRPGSIFEAVWYVPTKKGYVFLYWYLQDDPKTEVESIPVTTDITLVAQWEAGWVVTLELDGGVYYDDFPGYITVAKNATLDLTLIRPTREDTVGNKTFRYAFEGWYNDAGSRVSGRITVTGDITLYVKWVSLGDFEPLLGVWTGDAGTYLLYFDEQNRLSGFYLFVDEIRSFVWTDSVLDGKMYSLSSGILSVGEGENAHTFRRAITKKMPTGNVPLSKLWTKGGVDDPLSIYLFEDGSGFLHADGRSTDISYTVSLDKLYLLLKNTNDNGNLLPGEVLLEIPLVDGKPSGFTVMGEDPGFIMPPARN